RLRERRSLWAHSPRRFFSSSLLLEVPHSSFKHYTKWDGLRLRHLPAGFVFGGEASLAARQRGQYATYRAPGGLYLTRLAMEFSALDRRASDAERRCFAKQDRFQPVGVERLAEDAH